VDGVYNILYVLQVRITKALVWLGSSRYDLRHFPRNARQRAGYELYLIQSGLQPSDWKSMPSIGAGVQEIRIRTELEHRVLYVAKFEEAIHVLHAFEKKSRKTASYDLNLAKSRFSELLQKRRRRKET
jgi:phage-related protein